MKKKLKYFLKYLFNLYYNLILNFLIPKSYKSEITFFQSLRLSEYDDIKFLESTLRGSVHQIDKSLLTNKQNKMDRLTKNIYELISRIELKGIKDTPTLIWARNVMKLYEIKYSKKNTDNFIKKFSYLEPPKVNSKLANDLSSLIKNRRSIRSFTEENIPDNYINYIIEIGLWAPSGCNRQNIEFLILKNEKNIQFCQKIAGEGNKFPTEASFVVVVLFDCRTYALPGHRHQAYLEGGAAIQNMLLYASTLGIGSIWLHWAGIESKNAKFRTHFKLPNWLLPIGLVCFGYVKHMPLLLPKRKLIHHSIYYPKT